MNRQICTEEENAERNASIDPVTVRVFGSLNVKGVKDWNTCEWSQVGKLGKTSETRGEV
jgi:hypothetical protein